MNDRLIVFYDGECAFCNRQVQFLLGRDKAERLAFAPLQGKTAEGIWERRPDLKPEPGGSFDSMLAVRDFGSKSEEIFQRSGAALEIARELGGAWRLLRIFRFIPRPVRDAAYNVIAKNRYRLFGKAEACMIMPGVDRARFLE